MTTIPRRTVQELALLYLCIYCKKPDWNAKDVMIALKDVLTSIFSLRLAAESLKMNPKWFDRPVCVEFSESDIAFDKREYAKRLLLKVGESSKLDDFLREAERLEMEFGDDERHQIHGHDFITFLSYYFREKGVTKKQFVNKDIVARSLPLCHEINQLISNELFIRVNNFCSRAGAFARAMHRKPENGRKS